MHKISPTGFLEEDGVEMWVKALERLRGISWQDKINKIMPLEKPTKWVKLDCPYRPDITYWATTFNWHITDGEATETRCGMPTESMHREGSLIKPGLDVGKQMQQMCEICARGKQLDQAADREGS